MRIVFHNNVPLIIYQFNLSMSRIHMCSLKLMDMSSDDAEIYNEVKIQMKPMDNEHYEWFCEGVQISCLTHWDRVT